YKHSFSALHEVAGIHTDPVPHSKRFYSGYNCGFKFCAFAFKFSCSFNCVFYFLRVSAVKEDSISSCFKSLEGEPCFLGTFYSKNNLYFLTLEVSNQVFERDNFPVSAGNKQVIADFSHFCCE